MPTSPVSAMFFGIFPFGEWAFCVNSASSVEYTIALAEVIKITTTMNALVRMPFALARVCMDIIHNVVGIWNITFAII